MNKKSIILSVLLVAILALVFFLGRSTVSVPVQNKPDYSKYERAYDSLIKINSVYQDSVKTAYKALDSIKSQKVINTKKVKHDIEKIKRFTYTSRHRFNDSVLRANGLK